MPVFAYWYDGGRPRGAPAGFIATAEDEAAGAVGLVEFGACPTLLVVGTEVWEEVVLLARSEEGWAVPLVVGCC